MWFIFCLIIQFNSFSKTKNFNTPTSIMYCSFLVSKFLYFRKTLGRIFVLQLDYIFLKTKSSSMTDRQTDIKLEIFICDCLLNLFVKMSYIYLKLQINKKAMPQQNLKQRFWKIACWFYLKKIKQILIKNFYSKSKKQIICAKIYFLKKTKQFLWPSDINYT